MEQVSDLSAVVTPLGMTEQEPSAREAVNAMVEAGLFDQLFTEIDEGGLQLTGAGGFLPEMIKAVLERGLQAELNRPGFDGGSDSTKGWCHASSKEVPAGVAG